MEDELSMSQIGLKKHYEARQKERSPVERVVMARAFATEFHAKYLSRAIERERSLTPWDDFLFIELFERLQEETSELYAASMHDNDMIGVMDECKDIANFAWFIYEQAKAASEAGA